MSPRLTRGEFWILNSLVETRYQLFCYAGPARWVRDVFNRQTHGLTETELLATLLRLFANGWIAGEETHGDRRSGDRRREPFEPTAGAIRAAFAGDFHHRPDPVVSLGLTAAGGEVWQAFASPRWERFVESWRKVERALDGKQPVTVRAADLDRGRRYLDLLRRTGDEVDPWAIEWREVRPFRATYWKTLPSGFEVTYRSPRLGRRTWSDRDEMLDDYDRNCAASDFTRWWDWA